MDKHGKVMSPLKGTNKSHRKPEFLRSKNQSTLLAARDEYDLNSSHLYQTATDLRSNRKKQKAEKGSVD